MTDAMPNLARLTFHDDDTRFDISSLPEPGESTVSRIVQLDAELNAALERDAAARGVSVEDLIRARLKGAA